MRGCCFLVAITLWAAQAHASPSSRLVYARGPGAESCPDESAFRKEVAARLGYDPFFPWAPRTVSVEIEVAEGRSRARVVVVDENGLEQGAQIIDGGHAPCGWLVRGAALAVSVSLDAMPTPPPPPREAKEDEAPPLERPPVQPIQPVVVRPAPATESPWRSPAHKRRTSLSLAPQFWLGYGQWPVVTAGVGGSVDLRYGAWGLGFEGRWDAPSTLDIAQGERAQLQRATGSLVPCGHVGVLALCGVVSFGETWANGIDVLDPKSAYAFYAAFGGRAGLDVPLGGRFRWQLVAELAGIATPMHLLVGTDHFDTSPVGASLGTSVSFSIFR